MIASKRVTIASLSVVGLSAVAFAMRGSTTQLSPEQIKDQISTRVAEPITPCAIDYAQTHIAIKQFDSSKEATAYAFARLTRCPTQAGTHSGKDAVLIGLPDGNSILSEEKIAQVKLALTKCRDVTDIKNPEHPAYLNALWSTRRELLQIANAGIRNEELSQETFRCDLGSTEQRVTVLLRALVQSGVAKINPIDNAVEVSASSGQRVTLRLSVEESGNETPHRVGLEVSGSGVKFYTGLKNGNLARVESLAEAVTAASPIFNAVKGVRYVDSGMVTSEFSGSGTNGFVIRREQLVTLLSQEKSLD